MDKLLDYRPGKPLLTRNARISRACNRLAWGILVLWIVGFVPKLLFWPGSSVSPNVGFFENLAWVLMLCNVIGGIFALGACLLGSKWSWPALAIHVLGYILSQPNRNYA